MVVYKGFPFYFALQINIMMIFKRTEIHSFILLFGIEPNNSKLFSKTMGLY